jgi:tRNA A37 threonylcarbamoyladenosine synthetase subunit TsaC/SUA5/YrdC
MQRVYDCSVDTDLLTGFRLAKVSLDRNELVVLPTDTVYGIAANAFSAKGVEALLNAKGRDRTMPPPVLIPKVETMSALAADLPLVANQLAAAFWPGAPNHGSKSPALARVGLGGDPRNSCSSRA